jgi:3-dehydroquinate dehydratase-2
MLGIREPDIYGKETYQTLIDTVSNYAVKLGIDIECYQSNHEGDIVDKIQAALGSTDGIVINPAAYTHTSIAILDALKSVGVPAVEVHISDVSKRESFRQISFIRDYCIKTIIGQGINGYCMAIDELLEYLKNEGNN